MVHFFDAKDVCTTLENIMIEFIPACRSSDFGTGETGERRENESINGKCASVQEHREERDNDYLDSLIPSWEVDNILHSIDDQALVLLQRQRPAFSCFPTIMHGSFSSCGH